jgi:lauroyl/myristoyl acyltransferase
MIHRLLIEPALRALGLLAADTASRLGGTLGIVAFHLGVRRRVASGCVATALGLRGNARRAVVRRSYASMGATFIELWTVGGHDGIERHLVDLNPTWLARTLARSPGCIFLTPHLGNWDLGAHGLTHHVPHMFAYAKAQHDPAIDELTNAQRRRSGIEVLLTQQGDRTAAVRALRGLRNGVPVGMMADQGPHPKEGVRAGFFGVLTWCHSGPAFFAKRANAPIVPGLCLRRRAGEFVLLTGRPLASGAGDEAALVQASMDLLAAMISACPGQYFWQHRRFKHHLGLMPRAVEPWKRWGLRLIVDPLKALPAAPAPDAAAAGSA